MHCIRYNMKNHSQNKCLTCIVYWVHKIKMKAKTIQRCILYIWSSSRIHKQRKYVIHTSTKRVQVHHIHTRTVRDSCTQKTHTFHKHRCNTTCMFILVRVSQIYALLMYIYNYMLNTFRVLVHTATVTVVAATLMPMLCYCHHSRRAIITLLCLMRIAHIHNSRDQPTNRPTDRYIALLTKNAPYIHIFNIMSVSKCCLIVAVYSSMTG